MVGDDRREQRSLLDLFIETSVPVLEDITASLASRRSTDLRRAAHNLRGSALTVGAIGIAEFARTLEAVSENPDWDSITLISDELHEEFARTSTYIQGMTQ